MVGLARCEQLADLRARHMIVVHPGQQSQLLAAIREPVVGHHGLLIPIQ